MDTKIQIRGTCPFCSRDIATDGGRMVDHGFQISHNYGYRAGSCGGVGRDAVEVSDKGLRELAGIIESEIKSIEAVIESFRRFRPIGIAPRVGDVFPEVVLVNSHDGSSAYNLLAGLFRLACSNGMVAAFGDVENVKVRHSGNVVSEVIEGANRILDVANIAADRAKKWSEITLAKNEQLILAEAAHSIRFPAQAEAEEGEVKSATIGDAITPERILAPRRSVDMKSDLWTTVNVIQENVIRGGQRGIARNANGSRRRVTSRPVNGIDQDVRLNQALWKMAEQMAKLKGVAA